MRLHDPLGVRPRKKPFARDHPLVHRNRSDFCDCDAHRGPQKLLRFPRQEKAMLHCGLRVRWKVASDLRFQAEISEPEIPSFWRISGNLAPSSRKSLAIAIVRFWCAKDHPEFSGSSEPADGVGVKFRVFPVICSCLLLS